MFLNSIKYILVIIILSFTVKVEAQKDSTFQKYLESNISTKSLQNSELVFVKQVLSKQRITLQTVFDKKGDEKNLEKVSMQTSILEKAIVHYVSMNHKVIINEMDMQKTNDDSELLLARMVYIKSKIWCMEERLQKRVKDLYSNNKEDVSTDKIMLETTILTENVINSLFKARRFDRMKYRYNQELVISNWELTATRLKENNDNIDKFDLEYKRHYRAMIVDLYTMIGVLAMF